jgi:hypothetical protein
MWAAKQPAEPPGKGGDAMARLITSNIAGCSTVVALSDVYDEWGGSFNHINASAAIAKCGKLPGGGRSSLVDKLCSTWLNQLRLSDLQGCVNVLWACVRLGPSAVERLWGPTWEAFIEHVQQESVVEGACVPQNLANPLWACAKLRKQLSAEDLQLLMQTFLQPGVLGEATPQNVGNITWALGELCRRSDWQGGVNQQDVQQLLGKQQLLLVSAHNQETSNVVFGLARMAGCRAPVVSTDFARERGKQLLYLAHDRIGSWEPHTVCNVVWACGELALTDTTIMPLVVAAAPGWLPSSIQAGLCQVVTACAELQYRDQAFIQACLQHALHLLGPQQQPTRQGRGSKPMTPADRDKLAAVCCISVARLDMQSLAGLAWELLSRSGVARRPSIHPKQLRQLWVFHNWLLQQQLLDGKGLTGLLTQQQLQQGKKEAQTFGLS